jgi:hypothetical protein
VKDPHRCCTSCGEFFVKVDQDLGLFRNILTTGNVKVNNIYLNNVTLVAPDQYIPNVGSIAGRIESADLDMYNNKTTNIEIEVKGNDVGGQVGDAYATGDVVIEGAKVGKYTKETKVTDEFVITTGDNAGGVIGNLNGQKTVNILKAAVGLAEVSAKKGSNAGGIAGNLEFAEGAATLTWDDGEMMYKVVTGFDAETASQINGTNVNVTLLRATEDPKDATSQTGYGESGDNVGGFVGNLWAVKTTDRINWTPQPGQSIEMWGTFRSTTDKGEGKVLAEGRNAGGLIGFYDLPETTLKDHLNGVAISSATDNKRITEVILDNIEATNGNAGGLIGWVDKGDAIIGGGYKDKDNRSTVTVNIKKKISAASGAAGLVGTNSDAVDVSGVTRKLDLNPNSAAVTVTVADYANTWTQAQFESGYAYNGSVSDSRRLCGSFAGLLGLGNELFSIHTPNVTAPAVIAKAKKQTLLFTLNPEGVNTHGVKNDKFWGDTKGYVGFMKNTGKYYIDGAEPEQGDQGFNWRTDYADPNVN